MTPANSAPNRQALRLAVQQPAIQDDVAVVASAKLALARALVFSSDWKRATEGVRLIEELRKQGAQLCCQFPPFLETHPLVFSRRKQARETRQSWPSCMRWVFSRRTRTWPLGKLQAP